ncbi:hypothetical protein [Leptotrichia sp. OH3620_COT-345]|uniref:hypothetical protein n=1 Tax=Leptotrichia sp. OH3620_COT-345 TaxID=2491048 RepID=UPI0011CFDC78|nr:hypothetical protein [Leptotrichia sp. OH3620_COT-345]
MNKKERQRNMCNRKIVTIFVMIIFMFFLSAQGYAADIDKNALEITQDVNGTLFGYIQFLQWIITGVVLFIAVLGIFPELFTAGRPPDLAGMFMKFIQAAVIIGITWAVGDLIYWIFGANIDPEMMVRNLYLIV